MKRLLIVILLSAASWAQNGGVIPFPNISDSINQSQQTANQTSITTAQTAQIRQQTALLKQQTEALKQQNELTKQQQQAALLAAKTSSSVIRKPRIDDVDLATGKPRFATYAEYEDAKDEWLIEETLRRFEALRPASTK